MTGENANDDEHLTTLSIAKQQWERTFDAISDPLMIVDGSYVIRRANLALADDLGMAIQRVVGQRCHEVRRRSTQAFPGDPEMPCAGCPVEQARREGTPRDGELQSRAGRSYRLRAYPIADTGGALAPSMVVCSYRDVTEDKQMTAELAHAEKLAAIGRLAGGVAHQINNPLGGIMAFAQILLRERCTPDEQREYLREIERSAFRCKSVIEALVRLAQQSPNAPFAPLSLNEVVKDALTLVSHKCAAQDIELRCQLDDRLPAVRGNARQLEQVLINLVTNACEALAGLRGGSIEVRTALVPGFVELEVADSGPGIDEAHLVQIFDPFFTTKEAGAGLGLAMASAVVREHGGRIVARNRPGGGALLMLSLAI